VAGLGEPQEPEEAPLAVERVVVDDDLRVGGHHVAGRLDEQRVDLRDLAIVLLEDGVELRGRLAEAGRVRAVLEALEEELPDLPPHGARQLRVVAWDLDRQDGVRLLLATASMSTPPLALASTTTW
jgi:hypothetical protein